MYTYVQQQLSTNKVCSSPGTAAWLDGANICKVCFGSWVIATLWSCLPFFGWGEYSPEPYGLSCTVAWRGYHTSTKDALYVICSFAFFTLAPVLLIVVSQCQILLKVCRFSYSLSARGIRTNLRLSMVSRRLQVLSFLSIRGQYGTIDSTLFGELICRRFINAWLNIAILNNLSITFYFFYMKKRNLANFNIP